MRRLGTQTRAAGIPAKVMQLIIVVGKIDLSDKLAIRRGTGVDIDDAQSVMLSILADVEQRDISKAFRWSLHCHAWGGIKGWVRTQSHIFPPYVEIGGRLVHHSFNLRCVQIWVRSTFIS